MTTAEMAVADPMRWRNPGAPGKGPAWSAAEPAAFRLIVFEI